MKKFLYLFAFTMVLSVGFFSGDSQTVKAEEDRPCYTQCQTWTYQSGYDFGCSISHQSDAYYSYLYDNYINDCGCTTYAAGMRHGFAVCRSGSGGTGNDNKHPTTCTTYNPKTKSYDTGPCPQ